MALFLNHQRKTLVSICKRFMPFISPRFYASCSKDSSKGFKVAVLGAAGGNAQPLSMLLKMCSLVNKLALFDIEKAVGVAADLSHIDTTCDVVGFGPEKLEEALKDSNIVIIAAGMPRTPNMSREAEFEGNSKIIKDLSSCISVVCPKACIVIVSNPVNSLVPLAAKVMKNCGTFDPKKIFGASTIDSVRARKFIGDLLKVNPQTVSVPVIGGHSGLTMVPIISQSKPAYKASQEDIVKLTEKIISAGYAVLKAKGGIGIATVSMSYATFRLVLAIMKGLNGEQGSKEHAFVPCDMKEVSFFSTEVVLGKDGVEKFPKLPKMNKYEQDLYCKAMCALNDEIKVGEDYVK